MTERDLKILKKVSATQRELSSCVSELISNYIVD